MAIPPTDDDTPGRHGMNLLKENINADMAIMGLAAMFTYHRHLDYWRHAELGEGEIFQRM